MGCSGAPEGRGGKEALGMVFRRKEVSREGVWGKEEPDGIIALALICGRGGLN